MESGDQEKAQVPEPPPDGGFWAAIWKEINPALRAMAGDAILFIAGILVLALAFLGLLGLERLGYPKAFIERLEVLHFWGYYAVLFVLLVDLVVKVASHAMKKK